MDWKFRITGGCFHFVNKRWREIHARRAQKAKGKHEVESPCQSRPRRKVTITATQKMDPKTFQQKHYRSWSRDLYGSLEEDWWEILFLPFLWTTKRVKLKTAQQMVLQVFRHTAFRSHQYDSVSCGVRAPWEPASSRSPKGKARVHVLCWSLFLLHGCTKDDWW